MAIKGSCDTAGAGDCEGTIIADTPQQLKTALKSKIQQIIAERLSFTAPSITANLEDGGALYQAQFNYEQHKEWKGTILKKSIDGDGTVHHSPSHPGNWDAGIVVRDQTKNDGTGRKIWTALPGIAYNVAGDEGWNNFTEDNSIDIENLFGFYGSFTSDIFFQSFGLISFLFCISIFFNGISIIKNKNFSNLLRNFFYSIVYIRLF